MNAEIGKRIAALEERRQRKSQRCPGCGQVPACGVVIVIDPDGMRRPASVNCMCDREPPAGPTKVFYAALLAAI